MAALFGLLYGVLSPDTKVLFALFKSLNLIVFAPALFYVFPDWPRWIAYLFPTYWLIDPIVEIGQRGATLGDVWWQLAIGAAICAAMVPLILRLASGCGRRRRREVCTGGGESVHATVAPHGMGSDDAVVGVAACGRTPYMSLPCARRAAAAPSPWGSPTTRGRSCSRRRHPRGHRAARDRLCARSMPGGTRSVRGAGG
jgi:hypothetical protein